MTKVLSLGLITFSALVLVGCQSTATPSSETPESTGTDTSTELTQAEGKSLTEIAADVLGGAAYKCTFDHIENQQQMTYILQGKKVSMTIDAPAAGVAQSRFISDGETTHIWDPATKKGMKMTALSEEEMKQFTQQSPQAPAAEVPDFNDPADLDAIQQEYTVRCNPTTVTDAEFTVPTDVEFQDLSELMETMKQFQPPQR
jgi:hypothetical protein